MNAVADLADAARHPIEKEPESRLREIPYNYTSLADMYRGPYHSPMKKYDSLTVVNCS